MYVCMYIQHACTMHSMYSCMYYSYELVRGVCILSSSMPKLHLHESSSSLTRPFFLLRLSQYTSLDHNFAVGLGNITFQIWLDEKVLS